MCKMIEDMRREEREEGRAEGRAEGRKEGLLSAARNMLLSGLSLDKIAEYVGLSLEEVQVLQAETRR